MQICFIFSVTVGLLSWTHGASYGSVKHRVFVCLCVRARVLSSSRGQTLSVSYIRLASLLLVRATIFF